MFLKIAFIIMYLYVSGSNGFRQLQQLSFDGLYIFLNLLYLFLNKNLQAGQDFSWVLTDSLNSRIYVFLLVE